MISHTDKVRVSVSAKQPHQCGQLPFTIAVTARNDNPLSETLER